MEISPAREVVGAAKTTMASSPNVNNPGIIIPVNRPNRPGPKDRRPAMYPSSFRSGRDLS
ncbi:MAG: hypothetical protein ABSF71_34480 [Terriglobia bacterium]|jgi:hypothetical protein